MQGKTKCLVTTGCTASDPVPSVQVGHNSVELAMEWLFSHPDDPSASAAPAPAAAEPAKDVAQQLKLAPAQVSHRPDAMWPPPSVIPALTGTRHTMLFC